MVHRNTEYKIKFYFPNEELSKKIWLDNIKFRESRRAMNLADHYWDFQISSQTCDCEACLATRVKLEGSGNDKSSEKKEKKHTSSEIEKEFKDAGVPEITYREAKTQTPKWITSPIRASSHSVNISTSKSNFSKPEIEKRPVVLKRNECIPSMKKRCRRNAPTPITSQNLTSRKLQSCQDMNSLFFPYGWNNETKNVGEMKTFNVLAPQKEVHRTAAMALRRKTDLEKSRHSHEEKMKQKSASLSSLPRVNHSSIWMTEYRENFAKSSMTSRILWNMDLENVF